MYTIEKIQQLLKEAAVYKAPPGPPPRKGLVWFEGTHRWRKKPDKPSGEELHRGNNSNFTSKLNDVAEKFSMRSLKTMIPIMATKSLTALTNINDMPMHDQTTALKESMSSLHFINDYMDNYKGESPQLRQQAKKIIGARITALENVYHHKAMEMFDLQTEFLADTIEDMAGDAKQLENAEVSSYIKDAQLLLTTARESYEQGDVTQATSDLLQGRDQMRFIRYRIKEMPITSNYLDFEGVEDMTYLAERMFFTQHTIISDESVPFPTDRGGKGIAAGQELEESNDLAVSFKEWTVPVLLFDTRDTTFIDGDVKNVGRLLQPILQKEFQESIEKRQPKVFSDTAWFDVVVKANGGDNESIGVSGLRPNQVGGFCNAKGVHIPERASTKTIVHELAHQLDIQDRVSPYASHMIKEIYKERLEIHGRAQLESMTVTPYAASNENEFFAESFAHFVTDPVKLYKEDRTVYRILAEMMFQ